MEEITQEKAVEFRQVAALLAHDIETLQGILENDPDLSRDDIVAQVGQLHEDMKALTTDKKVRESRFSAMAMIYGLAHGFTPTTGNEE